MVSAYVFQRIIVLDREQKRTALEIAERLRKMADLEKQITQDGNLHRLFVYGYTARMLAKVLYSNCSIALERKLSKALKIGFLHSVNHGELWLNSQKQELMENWDLNQNVLGLRDLNYFLLIFAKVAGPFFVAAVFVCRNCDNLIVLIWKTDMMLKM
jgi:hypothetical protein